MTDEMNFDGIVGLTHNYSGLPDGDLASMKHSQQPSNPKKAVLEGLSKMKLLHSLGIKQGVLPPQERPFIPILRNLGFFGTDSEVIEKAQKTDPKLLMICSSAASMWTANAATISPSVDSNDKRVHFTVANLMTNLHRSFEAATTGLILYRIFSHPAYFAHHRALPFHPDYADEGAANHARFCRRFDESGIQLFVYGRSHSAVRPKKFPARQTEAASRAIARLHRLSPSRTLFVQQNPDAIDAGVFHNDVISVGHQNVFFYHEKAFVNTPSVIERLREDVETYCKIPLLAIEVKEEEVSLQEAVNTYLFNSQIITLADETMVLIAPTECRDSPSVKSLLERVIADSKQPIRRIIYQEMKESMQNGGGPACLRLRIVLTKTEYEAMNPHVQFTDELYQKLVKWAEKYYRDRLTPSDLADPQLLVESREALDELSSYLQLGSIYSFQRMSGPSPSLPEMR